MQDKAQRKQQNTHKKTHLWCILKEFRERKKFRYSTYFSLLKTEIHLKVKHTFEAQWGKLYNVSSYVRLQSLLKIK